MSDEPMRTPDAVLAYKVLDYIKAHPEEHDQSTWFTTKFSIDENNVFRPCGTAACFAGWTAILAGYKPHSDSMAGRQKTVPYDDVECTTGSFAVDPAVCDVNPDKMRGLSWVWDDNGVPDGGGLRPGVHRIRELARDLLGLDHWQASNLFYGGNTIETIESFVEEYFGPRPG